MNKDFINTFDSNDMTALHYAIKNDSLETVETLLKAGADPNIININNLNRNPPLLYCTDDHKYKKTNNFLIFKLLLKYGANPNTLSKITNRTVLLATCENELYIYVKELIEYGSKINKPSIGNNRSTYMCPLEACIGNNYKNITQLLLEHNADIMLALYYNKNLLTIASMNNDIVLVQNILDAIKKENLLRTNLFDSIRNYLKEESKEELKEESTEDYELEFSDEEIQIQIQKNKMA
jgi:ankyrin repeat protein